MVRGVLGGSFDPIHNGHVAMVEYVLARNLCQVLHVIPAWCSPHKTGTLAAAEHRLAMVRLALADRDDLVVDLREIQRTGPSYTVETLEELKSEHPQDSLLLIIGADSWADFGHWKDPERIAALCAIGVLARETPADPSPFAVPSVPANLDVRHYSDFQQPVSSTEIRAMLGEGYPHRAEAFQQMPPPVVTYIRENQLYQD